MTGDPTHMSAEVAEIPAAAARFLSASRDQLEAAAAAMRAADPRLVVTVARGSSDHAATYLKYAVELVAGIPVASVGPSVASVYGRRLRLEGAACFGISQSGQSPDIVEMMRSAGAGGALTLAVTNEADVADGAACDHTLPLRAGPEKSVAATKTFVASVLAVLALIAEWREDEGLRAAVAALPEQFERALACDWTPLADRLVRANSAFVLGRGPGFAIAAEMALKFKETCAHPRRELQRGGGAARAGGHRPGAFPGARPRRRRRGAAAGGGDRRAAGGARRRRVPDRRRRRRSDRPALGRGRPSADRAPGARRRLLPLHRGAGAAARLQPRHAAATCAR